GRTADCYSETQLCKSVSVRPCFCSPSAAEENSHRYRTLRPQRFAGRMKGRTAERQKEVAQLRGELSAGLLTGGLGTISGSVKAKNGCWSPG
ncbi:hypothetical protein LEMLEM_LOCUS3381, partial [Lemmus lemmus]